MATGSMATGISLRAWRHCTGFVLAGLLLCNVGIAQEVGLAGILGNKAMLVVNGSEPQSVRIGESVSGVRLVSIQGDQVTLDVGGKLRPLHIGQNAVGVVSADGSGKLVMMADAQGHFLTTGSVNGASVRFLVDTGASMISLGASDARRMGLDFNRGQKVLTHTANGQAVVSKVQLDTVRIGDITLHQVDALIHSSDMPVALLGMSFLNRMDMQRDGSTMTLKKRY